MSYIARFCYVFYDHILYYNMELCIVQNYYVLYYINIYILIFLMSILFFLMNILIFFNVSKSLIKIKVSKRLKLVTKVK